MTLSIDTKSTTSTVSDDVIAELERENNMLHARNERLEKEITWLEAALANAQIQLHNKINESNH